MCGRFTLAKDADALRRAFPGLPVEPRIRARHNIAPTQPVVAWLADPVLRMDILTWGLVPPWAREPAPLLNARAETAAEKPSFRNAWRRKRCALPADGWFEWTAAPGGRRQPMYFHRRDGAPFVIAGLWEEWHDRDGGLVLGCALLTTRPNALARRVHPRMPALLRPEDLQPWLDPLTPAADLPRMLEPVPADDLTVHPVSPEVNRAGPDHPGLLLPWSPPALPQQTELF